ncbi:MAG: heme-dependent peroxidase [Acidobacteria bacterium]|nr:heme-dependent peroxidase [Acidobacteriota bacterium]
MPAAKDSPKIAHHGAAKPTARKAEMPPVPLTLDGSAVLHQMFRVRWAAWRALTVERRREIVAEASKALSVMEQHPEGGSAIFSELGHKGDLLLVHFRKTFEGISQAELAIAGLDLSEYLEPSSSYVSTVELGLYASSIQLYQQLMDDGIEPGSDDWVKAEQEKLVEQSQAMGSRLFPRVPPHKYVCFYPMDKKRSDADNWYTESIQDRGRMMRDHGMIGRRYAGKVKQIISGSIGFDDWEWGVDLFANDPAVFKQLIYEMRFDEASALYALFGTFYIGLRFNAADLGVYLSGKPPAYDPPEDTDESGGPPPHIVHK